MWMLEFLELGRRVSYVSSAGGVAFGLCEESAAVGLAAGCAQGVRLVSFDSSGYQKSELGRQFNFFVLDLSWFPSGEGLAFR